MELQRISDERVFEIHSTERANCVTSVLIYEGGWHWVDIDEFKPYIECR